MLRPTAEWSPERCGSSSSAVTGAAVPTLCKRSCPPHRQYQPTPLWHISCGALISCHVDVTQTHLYPELTMTKVAVSQSYRKIKRQLAPLISLPVDSYRVCNPES